MKMTKDYLAALLASELETITATVLKRNIGECLTQVSMGKSFCVKRKGKIVGFFVSPSRADVTHVVAPDGSCETLEVRHG